MPPAPAGPTASPDDPKRPTPDMPAAPYAPPPSGAAPADGEWATDELHRLLVASVQDYAIFAVTAEGRIASWNAGAQRLKGYAAEEIIGQHLSVFYPPETRRPDGIAPRVLELLDRAAREGRAEDEAWRVRRDGTRFWANVVLTAVRGHDGRLLGFAKVTRDLTERRAAEQRARALAAETAARETAERDTAEIRALLDRVQEQAIELEAQTEEAQNLAEELEQSNEQLQQTTEEAEQARDAAERGVARLERLQQITATLAAAVDVDAVVERAVKETRAALGAAAVYVARRTPDPAMLELVHGEGFPMALEHVRYRFPLDAPWPGALVVRTGEALWFGSPAERQERLGAGDDSPVAKAFAASATLPLKRDGETTGSLGIFFGAPRAFTPDERAFVNALAEQVALAMERARLFELEHRTRMAAAAAQARAEFLSEASHLLGGSLDYASTLEALARAAVPRLADWCTVDMLTDPQATTWPPELQRLAVMHDDPARIALAQELRRRQPIDWDQPRGLPRVLRDGVTEFFPDIPDELLVAAAKSPEHLALLREMGLRAMLCVPLRVRGHVVGAITLVMAESGRRYEDADRTLAEELAHRASLAIEHATLYREAQQANVAKMRFLATMSHELRTPLNAIGGYAELLALQIRGPLTAAQQVDLERIRRSQQHLLGLIDDVLEFARIEAGQAHYRVAPVPLLEAVEGALTLVAPQASAKRQRLEVVPCDDRLAVHADREKLQQILVNLLANAVKFTGEGGHVRIACEPVGDLVEVNVADTGIGIPEDRLATIFDPFVQVQPGLTRTVGGTGLGLAISRDYAVGMNGALRVRSTPGEGSTFTLTLPAARGE